MSIIEEYINRPFSTKKPQHRDYGYNKERIFDARKADKQIKYCTTCKRCWELDTTAVRNLKGNRKGTDILRHYNGFPTLGKERQTCRLCKTQKEKG